MDELVRLDPITRHVRGLPDPYWMLREAADILGISRNRLRRLARLDPDTLGPGHVTWLGDVKIFLYDDRDLDDLRAYFAHRRTLRPPVLDPLNAGRGRPPTWTDEEQEDRHRRGVNARYHRLQAERHEHAGRSDRAAKHRARTRALTEALHSELAQRRTQLASRR